MPAAETGEEGWQVEGRGRVKRELDQPKGGMPTKSNTGRQEQQGKGSAGASPSDEGLLLRDLKGLVDRRAKDNTMDLLSALMVFVRIWVGRTAGAAVMQQHTQRPPPGALFGRIEENFSGPPMKSAWGGGGGECQRQREQVRGWTDGILRTKHPGEPELLAKIVRLGWKDKDILTEEEVLEDLEEGDLANGAVALVDGTKVEELRRLAADHHIDRDFALIIRGAMACIRPHGPRTRGSCRSAGSCRRCRTRRGSRPHSSSDLIPVRVTILPKYLKDDQRTEARKDPGRQPGATGGPRPLWGRRSASPAM